MEIILKILEYVMYGLLAVVAIMIPILFYCKYMEAKFARQWAGDLEQELEEVKKEFKHKESALIKEAQDWKLKATAPMMPDPNPPIIIHKSDLQKVIIHTELDRFKSKEQAIREGVDKLRDFIAPMVYSEFREDYGKPLLHQEIWIGLSENF
jgi:hypothetical protein